MKKCPCCGAISDHHTIGGEDCLGRRLKRSEARRTATGNALADFINFVLHDTDIPDEVRNAVLKRLYMALLENQYEEMV